MSSITIQMKAEGDTALEALYTLSMDVEAAIQRVQTAHRDTPDAAADSGPSSESPR